MRLQFQSLGVLSKLRGDLAMNILAMSKETAAKATVDVETSCGVNPAFRRRSVLFDVEDKQSARSLSNNVKIKNISAFVGQLKTKIKTSHFDFPVHHQGMIAVA